MLCRIHKPRFSKSHLMLGRPVCCAAHLRPRQLIPYSTSSTISCLSLRAFRAAVPSRLSSDINTPASLFLASPLSHVSSSLYSNMSLRRSKTSAATNGGPNGHAKLTNGSASHGHSEGNAHEHSIFSSHSHGEEGNIEEHEKILEALRGGGKYLSTTNH